MMPIVWVLIGAISAALVAFVSTSLGHPIWPGIVIALLLNTYFAARNSRSSR